MKRFSRPIALALMLSGLVFLTGCQSSPPTAEATNDSAAQNSSMRTPDGDRLDQPIPYPHYPYDIARGGGGGSTGVNIFPGQTAFSVQEVGVADRRPGNLLTPGSTR